MNGRTQTAEPLTIFSRSFAKFAAKNLSPLQNQLVAAAAHGEEELGILGISFQLQA